MWTFWIYSSEVRYYLLSSLVWCLMRELPLPTALEQGVPRQLHSSHPGISWLKMLTRGYIYWPRMDKDIEMPVKGCFKCRNGARSPPCEKPTPRFPTKTPWSGVHVGFAGAINGVVHLVLVDSHSRWPEVITMPSAHTAATTNALDRIFTTHVFPETLVSDNGSQFC